MTRSLWLVGILLAWPVALRGTQNTRPTAQAILEQAAAYVADVMKQFSVVIGEESYGARPRAVKSDVLFLRSPGDTGWLYYRDTYESREGVVRPHEDRFTRLFESPATVGRELANIERSQARYQNGSGRTFAHPLLALSFLQAGLQSRFAFTLRNLDKGVGPAVWIVEYKETERPTLLRGAEDSNRPISGRFWVEWNTGRVMQTVLRVSTPGNSADVTTVFRLDETFHVAVPVEMREQYVEGGSRASGGVTTYGRFRPLLVAPARGTQRE